jgi:hypothetical protein
VTTTADDLPDDIAALQAALIAERARAARVEAELAVAKARASDDQALLPLLHIGGTMDQTGAPAVSRAAYRRMPVTGWE